MTFWRRFWQYSQAYVGFDRVNHSKSIFITAEIHHAGQKFMLAPLRPSLAPQFFHSKIATGGNTEILLILYRLLTMQCKWSFTKRFRPILSTPLVCAGWTSILKLLSEIFSTPRLSKMIFLFMNCLLSIFWAFSTNKSSFKNNHRLEQKLAMKKQES